MHVSGASSCCDTFQSFLLTFIGECIIDTLKECNLMTVDFLLLPQLATEVTVLVCAIKPLCAWNVEEVATCCRER
jgi:hypothetical protein